MPRMTNTPKNNRIDSCFNPKRFRDFVKYAHKEGRKDQHGTPNFAATARDILYFILGHLFFKGDADTTGERRQFNFRIYKTLHNRGIEKDGEVSVGIK